MMFTQFKKIVLDYVNHAKHNVGKIQTLLQVQAGVTHTTTPSGSGP
jgi:hypothetical protein